MRPLFVTTSLLPGNDLTTNNLYDDKNSLENYHQMSTVVYFILLLEKNSFIESVEFPTYNDLKIYFALHHFNDIFISDKNLSKYEDNKTTLFLNHVDGLSKKDYKLFVKDSYIGQLSFYNTIHVAYPSQNHNLSVINKYKRLK